MKLALDKIRLDGGTQPRAELLLEVIDDYAEQMRGGAEFPPVIVFFDGRDYWLADGFHRIGAARQVDPDRPIEVEVRQGTQSDAQWFSYSVNQAHGLRRTNEDKQRAVVAALSHPNATGLSDRAIAEHCGVSNRMVGVHRRKLPATVNGLQSDLGDLSVPDKRPRKGRDGRTTNTSRIGSKQRSSSKGRSRLKVHLPVRGTCPVEKLTTVSLPHNAVMGARTLLEVFPIDYVRALVEELNRHLTPTQPISQ